MLIQSQLCRDSAPILVMQAGDTFVIETTTSGVKVSNLVIVIAVVGSALVLLFLAILYFLRFRIRKKQQANRKKKGQLRTLRQLMNSMNEQGKVNESYHKFKDLSQIAFVITGVTVFMGGIYACHFDQPCHCF